MNVMITSPGRRVELIEYFKKELNRYNRKLYTLDMSAMAPALYFANHWFVIKKDFNRLDEYIKNIIDICKKNNITTIFTLIDPELVLFRKFENLFNAAGINLFMPDKKFNDETFDKYLFYTNYKNILPLIHTYDDAKNIENDLPVIAKDRYGSGSIGINLIETKEELQKHTNKDNLIFQPKMKDFDEYTVHMYFDSKTSKVIDIFMAKVLSMRAGESDKAISVWREDIYNIVSKLQNIKGIKGTINVDIFILDDKVYVNEINPRFGGGYNHAHYCGCDFVSYSVNNILGKRNSPVNNYPNYELGVEMMKYNAFFFKKGEHFG